MVMTTTTAASLAKKNVSTHYWLKHKDESKFHVFTSTKFGAHSICEQSLPMGELKEMSIPGDRSPCCFKCMSVLYGFLTPASISKGKK